MLPIWGCSLGFRGVLCERSGFAFVLVIVVLVGLRCEFFWFRCDLGVGVWCDLLLVDFWSADSGGFAWFWILGGVVEFGFSVCCFGYVGLGCAV